MLTPELSDCLRLFKLIPPPPPAQLRSCLVIHMQEAMRVLLLAVWDIFALLGLKRNQRASWNLTAFGWRGCSKGVWKTLASHGLLSPRQPGWGGCVTVPGCCVPGSDLCCAASDLCKWPGRGKEEHPKEVAGLGLQAKRVLQQIQGGAVGRGLKLKCLEWAGNAVAFPEGCKVLSGNQ